MYPAKQPNRKSGKLVANRSKGPASKPRTRQPALNHANGLRRRVSTNDSARTIEFRPADEA